VWGVITDPKLAVEIGLVSNDSSEIRPNERVPLPLVKLVLVDVAYVSIELKNQYFVL